MRLNFCGKKKKKASWIHQCLVVPGNSVATGNLMVTSDKRKNGESFNELFE